MDEEQWGDLVEDDGEGEGEAQTNNAGGNASSRKQLANADDFDFNDM